MENHPLVPIDYSDIKSGGWHRPLEIAGVVFALVVGAGGVKSVVDESTLGSSRAFVYNKLVDPNHLRMAGACGPELLAQAGVERARLDTYPTASAEYAAGLKLHDRYLKAATVAKANGVNNCFVPEGIRINNKFVSWTPDVEAANLTVADICPPRHGEERKMIMKTPNNYDPVNEAIANGRMQVVKYLGKVCSNDAL